MRKVCIYFGVYSFATVRVIRCICALKILAFLSLNRITMHSQQSANVTAVGSKLQIYTTLVNVPTSNPYIKEYVQGLVCDIDN